MDRRRVRLLRIDAEQFCRLFQGDGYEILEPLPSDTQVLDFGRLSRLEQGDYNAMGIVLYSSEFEHVPVGELIPEFVPKVGPLSEWKENRIKETRC